MLFRVLWISKTSLLFSVFLKFVVVNVMSADKGEPFHLNLRFKNNTGFLYFIFISCIPVNFTTIFLYRGQKCSPNSIIIQDQVKQIWAKHVVHQRVFDLFSYGTLLFS